MLELRLFGPPRVALDGEEIRFDTRKALALLAYLAVTGREHTRERLSGLLWPDLDRQRARATLRRTLSVASAVGDALVAQSDRVGLHLELVECDVTAFRLLAQTPSAENWREAVGLAGDGFLAGFTLRDSVAFEEWQIDTADTLRAELALLLGRLVEEAVDRGDVDGALSDARRRVAVDPLSEPAHADVIRMTAMSGDRAAALQAYRSLVRLLDRELGVPPLPGTVALHEAIRADRIERIGPAASDPDIARVHSSQAVQIVGRGAELAAITRALRDSVTAGRALGFSGEAGMGKTTIARLAVEEAASSDVLWIAGHTVEQDFPYAAAGDLIRSLFELRPDLAARLGDAAAPLAAFTPRIQRAPTAIRGPGDLERLHEAVRGALALAGHSRPVLAVVDDAHRLDGPSAALLAYVARRAPAGFALLATWEPGSSGAVLPHAVRDAGSAFALRPLTAAEVADLAPGADPDEVLRRTGGIPLLVSEAVESGAGHDPASVRGVVAARVDAASEVTRQVVAAAAVIGTVADPDLLRVTSGRTDVETVDAIEEAQRRGLLVERADRGGYDLPHELVRDASLSRLSLARTRLLHGRAADALARRHTADPMSHPAAAVARHLAAAAREEHAAEWFVIAAAESERLGAHAESLAALESALALGLRTADVHRASGRALVRLGRYADARAAFDRGAALADGDPALGAVIEHEIAGVYDRLGDTELALSHLRSAEELAPSGTVRARIVSDLSLILHREGDRDGAERFSLSAQHEADAAADDAARAHAANVRGVLVAAGGDRAQARKILEGAVATGRALEDPDLLISTLNTLSHVLADAPEPELRAEALAAAQEAVTLADRQGDTHRSALLHSHLADLLHADGREDEALAELKASARALAQVDASHTRPEVWILASW